MMHSPTRSSHAATCTLGGAALGFVTPAFAALAVSAEQWPTYLLYGSIALLVAGVVGRMVTYGARASAPDRPPAPQPFSIGMYRNSVLSSTE